MEHIILVDENDNEVGTEEKLAAHQRGALHRCFSIFVFNAKNELLLQQRAFNKYHSGGLWSNTCCSHQRPNEETLSAAHRRLQEEMGFDCGFLKEKFCFLYKAALDHGITEHEFDHALFGRYEGPVAVNPEEGADYKWISLPVLENELKSNPEKYTEWLKVCFSKMKEELLTF